MRARGRGRGDPGLFADSNRAPATNPTGRAIRSSRECASRAQYRLGGTRTRLAERLVRGSIGRTASPTRLVEWLVRAAAPGDDSQPGAWNGAPGLQQFERDADCFIWISISSRHLIGRSHSSSSVRCFLESGRSTWCGLNLSSISTGDSTKGRSGFSSMAGSRLLGAALLDGDMSPSASWP